MTNVITRYFDDVAKARAVRHELIHRRRFSQRILRLIEDADGLTQTLTAEGISEETAKAYQKRMKDGGAVMIVWAGHKPLSVAQTTRDVTREKGAVDFGDLEEEVFVRREPSKLSILEDHPHILLRQRDPLNNNRHMADWPIPLISRREPFRMTVFPLHSRMASFPFPLISRRKPYTGSIIERHGRMANYPWPLLSDRKPYTHSIIPPHKRMADFPLPLISRRKPYTGSILRRHQRMANWPFPLLIDGKQGENALMPGGPRMANFPIPLISKREPYTGSAIAKHGRMANFPIPLISKRKPFTGSAIEKHGHMANFPWPLVVKRDGRDGFSFSKLFGWPTVIRK